MSYQYIEKAIYKKWWFVVIAVFISLGIIGFLSENSEEPTSQPESTTQAPQDSEASLSPAEYICDELDGELSSIIENRNFVGDTYRCDVDPQWDMMIMDNVNSLIIEDEYFGNAQTWKETFVDTENYSRRSFSFESNESYIINLYVPFEKETDHFYIAE